MAIDNNQSVSFAEAYNLNKPAQQGQNQQANNGEPRPKSQFWLNVGYKAVGATRDEQGNMVEKEVFISLPMGMALDDQKPRDVSRITNEEFRNQESARNDLLAAVMQEANKLLPGETRMVNLQIQIRRIRDDQAPTAPETNPFGMNSANLFS